MSAPSEAEADEMAKAWAELLTSDISPRAFAAAVAELLDAWRGKLTEDELSCLQDLAVLRLARGRL